MGLCSEKLPARIRIIRGGVYVLLLVLTLYRMTDLAWAAEVNYQARSLLQGRYKGLNAVKSNCMATGTVHAQSPSGLPSGDFVARKLIYDGVTAWLVGDCDLATEQWARATLVSPQDKLAWFYAGYGAMAKRDKPYAASAFREAGAGKFVERQASQHQRDGDLNGALLWYQVAAETQPSIWTLNQLSQLYEYMGRTADALDAWRSFSERLPESDPDSWWAMGQMAELRNDWQTAVSAYGRGALLVNDPYSFYERQGMVYRDAGNPELALKSLERAMMVRPDVMWAPLFAGNIERSQGHASEARMWYLKASRVDPRAGLPYLYLAVLAINESDYKLAAQYLAMARTRNWSTTDDFYWNLERSVSLLPREASSWYLELGDNLAHVGEVSEAVCAYQRVLTLTPGNQRAMSGIESLGYNTHSCQVGH